MKLVISPKARDDLLEIEEYIGTDNPRAALDFVSKIVERCRLVAEFPSAGRKRDKIKRGYRSVTHGDYVILYTISRESVEIQRVIHGKRDLGKALKD